MKEVEYVAFNSEGNRALVYSVYQSAFYSADISSGEIKKIFKREKDKPGFALYGERKSRLSFINGDAVAWGYMFDKDAYLTGDVIVRINPDKTGMAAFEEIMPFSEITRLAKSCYSKAETIQNIDVNKNFMTTVLKGENEDAGGVIIAYSFFGDQMNKHFKVASFKSFSCSSIAAGADKYAYNKGHHGQVF